ncbi:MAG TPA: PilZ domain-containing protein [Nitrospiria bacterium]|nr:PilZ domain-containing protein [Nitrospiria bacterium]
MSEQDEKPSQSPATEKDRRGYVRVRTECLASYRLIEGEDTPRSRKEGSWPIPLVPVPEGLDKLHPAEDATENQILNLLLWVDWKTSFLIKNLIHQGTKKLFPHGAMITDISASGARFTTPDPLKLGTQLELEIILPIVPYREMLISGKVVRVLEKPSEGSDVREYEAGFEFTFEAISDSDRDHIIRYILKRQMQSQRERREHDTD